MLLLNAAMEIDTDFSFSAQVSASFLRLAAASSEVKMLKTAENNAATMAMILGKQNDQKTSATSSAARNIKKMRKLSGLFNLNCYRYCYASAWFLFAQKIKARFNLRLLANSERTTQLLSATASIIRIRTEATLEINFKRFWDLLVSSLSFV